MLRKTASQDTTRFFTANLIGYYAAIAVILLGYLLLSIGTVNSVTSLTLGPVVLVIGYIVAIPIALLAGSKHTESTTTQADAKDIKKK